MHADDNQLDIGGHSVCPGGKVNVCWMGTWQTGTVLKVGPQAGLCKVIDPITLHTFLADESQLKFMQTQILDREFTRGAKVCYNDGEGWIEGVVEDTDAVGAAFVLWHKSIMSEESENWFGGAHIGPIISNEAYRGDLQQSESGPLPFELHRSKTNLLYESDADSEPAEYESPVSKRRRSPKKRAPSPISPTYETIPQQKPARRNAHHTYDVPYPPLPTIPHPPLPLGPYPPLPPPPHLHPANHFPVAFPRFIPYGQRWIKRSPSAMSAPMHHPLGSSPIKHPLRPKAKYTNGIPPHHSSKFFKQLSKRKGVGNQQRSSPAHFVVKPSPTLHSVTNSEPIPFTHTLSRTVIPRRHLADTTVTREQTVKKPKQKKAKQKKKQPQLYENPMSFTRKADMQPQLATGKPDVDKQADNGRDTPDRHRKEGPPPPPPEITSASPQNLHVFAGGRILLTCAANSSSTPVTYTWLKDDQPLPEKTSNIEHISPSILDIQASLQDRGTYSCIVSNEYGSSRRDFNLQVTEATVAKQPGSTHTNPTSQESFTNLFDSIKNEMDDMLNENSPKSFYPSASERPPGDGMESEVSNNKQTELPQITVTTPTRRTSSVLKNDMEQYLGGYGSDYGVTSSTTDLEMEGLKPFKSAEIHRSLKTKEKKRNKYKRKWPRFKKKSTAIAAGEVKRRDLPESDQHLAGVKQSDTDSSSDTISIIYEDQQSNAESSEINSIAVNTSLGSDHSVGSGEDTPHVQLPLATESATEQIRRLQISTELYGPQSEKPQKVKKKSFLSALLSRSPS